MSTSRTYTLEYEDGEASDHSRKDSAIKAGDASGLAYQVRSPAGKVVHESAAEPGPLETRRVSFTEAGHFWTTLGREAGTEVVSLVREVSEVKSDNNAKQLLLTGGTASLDEAEQLLKQMWFEATVALKEWQKTNKKYRTTSGRKEKFELVKSFLRKNARSFVTLKEEGL